MREYIFSFEPNINATHIQISHSYYGESFTYDTDLIKQPDKKYSFTFKEEMAPNRDRWEFYLKIDYYKETSPGMVEWVDQKILHKVVWLLEEEKQ